MARVPKFPGEIDSATLDGSLVVSRQLRAATPVRGPDQWWDWAKAQAWLSGRGSQLVSMGPSLNYMGPGFATNGAETIAIATRPHKQHTAWLWILGLSSPTGTAASGTFDGSQGAELGSWSMPKHPPDTPFHFYFLETFTVQTISYVSYSVVIHLDSPSPAYIYRTSLQAIELPLRTVSTIGSADKDVVDFQTVAVGAPIYEPSSGRKSIYGVTRAATATVSGNGLIREARRNHLFSWEFDTDAGGITITDTTYPGSSQFFEMPPTVLARHLYTGTTTATVTISILAEAEGAPNTGAVKITASGGDVCSIDVTALAPTWYSGTIQVKTEDLSNNGVDGGLRGAGRETLTVVAKVTGGTTRLRMSAFYVMEQE